MMRFPNSKMVQEWSYFGIVTMKNVKAQLLIEAWSPSVGAKSVLQQAWFRVKETPSDQRSIRTLAKVGGLVGKVMEIDEKTRFKLDFIRMKIACRDVTRVPRTAEGTLGIYVKDFIFEREIQDDEPVRTLTSGIKVTDPDVHPNKNYKAEE